MCHANRNGQFALAASQWHVDSHYNRTQIQTKKTSERQNSHEECVWNLHSVERVWRAPFVKHTTTKHTFVALSPFYFAHVYSHAD
mmetsp:Transcript_4346/g.16385  ORF Transcript_4346/g.16385 Transcript_4346/m.16385 type:complete len:85 (-) Transcript_4346:1500-1754(-)